MSRTYRGKDRQVRVRSQRRKQPDIRKLGQAVIALAQARAEAEAEGQHRSKLTKQRRSRPSGDAA